MADSTGTEENSVGRAGNRSKRAEGGFLERTMTRLFMREARVVRVVDLSNNFRNIEIQGDALKSCEWSPGDKIQMKLDGGFITRTYTPCFWDRTTGAAQILIYSHGTGPGSAWAEDIAVGDECRFFGPRNSLSLENLGSSTVLFGDETSFALALAMEFAAPAGTARDYIFEVNNKEQSLRVLAELGFPTAILVERTPQDGHLSELAQALAGLVPSTRSFVLSGKAGSIQYVRKALLSKGVDRRILRTKAYWAPGKVGLD